MRGCNVTLLSSTTKWLYNATAWITFQTEKKTQKQIFQTIQGTNSFRHDLNKLERANIHVRKYFST